MRYERKRGCRWTAWSMASPQFTFQLHRIEYVPAKTSPLYEDGMCIFAKDAKVFQVPTLHLYGRTSDGSSVCAKIRNLYPYFYIEVPQPYPEVYHQRLSLFVLLGRIWLLGLLKLGQESILPLMGGTILQGLSSTVSTWSKLVSCTTTMQTLEPSAR